MTLLIALIVAGCANQPAQSTHRASPSANKKPLPRLECAFAGDGDNVHRTYLIERNFLVDTQAPKPRYRITSDDGETLTAEHLDVATKIQIVINIDFRQHAATITQAGKTPGSTETLTGACTESG
jgi:hypothetical protein